jgi:hypothetical protein
MRPPLLLLALPLLLASCGGYEPEPSQSTSETPSGSYDVGGGGDQESAPEPTDDEPSRPQPAAAEDPAPSREDCDRSYPDFCIPPPPPDLDCKDVDGPKPFRVRRPDAHNFDRDGDGKACEPNPRRRRN